MRMLSTANIEHSNETGLNNKKCTVSQSRHFQRASELVDWEVQQYHQRPRFCRFLSLYTHLIQPWRLCIFDSQVGILFSLANIHLSYWPYLSHILILNLRHETALRPKPPTLETESGWSSQSYMPVWRRSETKMGVPLGRKRKWVL